MTLYHIQKYVEWNLILDELRGQWGGGTYFKVLHRNLMGVTEDNHKYLGEGKCYPGWYSSWVPSECYTYYNYAFTLLEGM
jgi:hypothetical protein